MGEARLSACVPGRKTTELVSFAVLLVGIAIIAAVFATRTNNIDAGGKLIGADFALSYATGELVREGRAADAYDFRHQHDAQKRLAGLEKHAFYPWFYPPFYLAFAAGLTLLPYLWALVVSQLAALGLYLATMWRILPRRDLLLPALAFPAVAMNMLHGQNGALTAVLFGAGMLMLDRRPVASGVLIGLLSCKPHLGLVIPLVLAATGRWRTFLAACATIAALTLASAVAFGIESWHAFFDALTGNRAILLDQTADLYHRFQSSFAALRLWGAPLPVAYAAHAALAAFVALRTLAIWRSDAAHELKAASLITASLLVPPYVFDYDLVATGPAMAFLAAHALRTGAVPLIGPALALAWFAPGVSRFIAEATGIPLGFLGLVALFIVVDRTALTAVRFGKWDRRTGPYPSPPASPASRAKPCSARTRAPAGAQCESRGLPARG